MQRCPNCQHENPSEAAFCMNCGAALSLVCTRCSNPLAVGARFCSHCGQPVAANLPSAEARPTKAAAPTPPQPSEKALTVHVEGERKVVTCLFADVIGSTAMAEKMDPEEWTTIMNHAFERLSPTIQRYEGTIAHLLGDALLAFFGAPITHEDDAVRAIRAALDLLAATRIYAEEVRREHGIEFEMRVGINTGMVVVGTIGSDLKYEYTAMGDAVNLAARMQSAADPGTVLIADNTHRLAAPFFEFEDRGQLVVKGKSEPVQVYQVIAEWAGVIQARGITGLYSPLVGREMELHTLQSALGELRQGRGQIVSVMAEAGLGKSRLVAEWRKTALPITGDDADYASVQWLEGRSLSYETATPYSPFADMFSDLFGVRVLQDNAEKYAHIKTAITEVAPQRTSDIAPFIASLMDIQPIGEDAERVRYLEAPNLRGKVFQAVSEWIGILLARGPLVLVFEDLHWADPTSLDLIDALMPMTDGAALMILALFRPRRNEPSWRFHEIASRDYGHRYTSVALNPLDGAQSRQLVANLLEIEDLPDRVRTLILAKAEGNPYFVEEVIRSLLDAGLVIHEAGHWRATREIETIAVPDSLSSVIGARLDRLDDGSKRAAQTAAVIGRQFEFDVLADVSQALPASASAKLDEAMGTLQRRELVREKSRLPSRAYAFKHVLVQETAYASLLLSRRRELHLRVAECLEHNAPDQVHEIGRHFLEAREQTRALPYLIEAADRAARTYSTPEATQYYRQALDALKARDDARLAQRAYEGLGQTQFMAGDMPGAIETYQTLLRYGADHADIPIQVSAQNKIARVMMFSGRLDEMEAYLLGAEKLAREYAEMTGLAEMFTVKCMACNFTGDFATGVQFMAEAAQIGKQLNVQTQIVYGLTHTAMMLTNMTRFDEGWIAAQEASEAIDSACNLLHKSELLGGVFVQHYLRQGNLEAAQQSAQQAIAIVRKIGYPYAEFMTTFMLGHLCYLQGNYESAITWLEQSQQVGRAMGLPFLPVYGLARLGLVHQRIAGPDSAQAAQYHTQALALLNSPMGSIAGGYGFADVGYGELARGHVDHAGELFQKGITLPSTQGWLNRPESLVGLAEVALARHDLDEAARHVGEAHQYVDERAMKHFYPAVGLAEARLSLARGDHERGLTQLAQAESQALAMGMRPIVWQTCAESANALAALGRATEAAAKRGEAQTMLTEMAGLFKDAGLRAKFVESAALRYANGATQVLFQPLS